MRKTVFLIVLIVYMFTSMSMAHMNTLQKKVIDTALTMVGGKYGWGSYDP